MKRQVGSSFNEFFAEEGLLSEGETTAVKRVIAYQLSQFMEAFFRDSELNILALMAERSHDE